MKNKPFFSFLCIALFVPFWVHSQSAFPFPKADAEWQFTTVSPIVGPNDYFDIYRNTLEGDTVYHGKQYSKAYRQHLCACICTSQSGPYNPAPNQQKKLIGGIREENGKVYFTTFGKQPFNDYHRPVFDTLLFDFTLKKGDTLLYDKYKLAVTKTETTPEGRKQIELLTYRANAPLYIYWTEGIGFHGLLETLNYIRYTYYVGSCFSQGPSNSCPIPCLLTPTETPALESQINIYPSASQNTVRVELGDGFREINLQIFSAQGQLLHSIYQSGLTANVDVQNFSPGLYLFVFEVSPGVRVSKWYLR